MRVALSCVALAIAACGGHTEVLCFADAGMTTCGGACVDTKTDPNNCGECNEVCSMADVCASGACVSAIDACNGTPAVAMAGSDMGMQLVPAGPFWEGCNTAADLNCAEDESPGRCVTLPAFEVDTTEVTQAAYQTCVSGGFCTAPGCTDAWTPSTTPALPVVCPTWAQATAYCASVGKRLPTEAEWEKAARGVDGRIYPWGNTKPTCPLANYDLCGENVDPIGQTTGLSPYGAVDMAGNASEWVQDWYAIAAYSTGTAMDPSGPDGGLNRVTRGGGCWSEPSGVRTSARTQVDPLAGGYTLGFRCAKSAD